MTPSRNVADVAAAAFMEAVAVGDSAAAAFEVVVLAVVEVVASGAALRAVEASVVVLAEVDTAAVSAVDHDSSMEADPVSTAGQDLGAAPMDMVAHSLD